MKRNSLVIVCFLIISFCISSCEKDKLGELPTISFTYSHNIGVSPVAVSFDAFATNTKNVSWDFGDGQTGTETSLGHTYTSYGLYNVIATATSPEGITAKQKKNILVSPYSQLYISRIHVTSVAPTYCYCVLYNSNGKPLIQTPAVGDSVDVTFSTPVLITDLEGVFSAKIMSGTWIQTVFQFRPLDYFTNTGSFPNFFTKNIGTQTVKLYVTWN